MRYSKPALSFDEQLDLLRRRGLTVRDPVRALRWLQSVNYYRLSAYFLPFKGGERFRPGTDFNDIAGLYIFDRKLRLLVLDAMQPQLRLSSRLAPRTPLRRGFFVVANAAFPDCFRQRQR